MLVIKGSLMCHGWKRRAGMLMFLRRSAMTSINLYVGRLYLRIPFMDTSQIWGTKSENLHPRMAISCQGDDALISNRITSGEEPFS